MDYTQFLPPEISYAFEKDEFTGKVPFELPDGTALSYTLPGWKTKCVSTNAHFLKFSRYINKHSNKECHMKVWSKVPHQRPQKQWLLFVDYDNSIESEAKWRFENSSGALINGRLCTPYEGQLIGWELFGKKIQKELGEKYGNICYPFKSRSGKLKLAILVEFPRAIKLKDDAARAIITTLLPESVKGKAIDLSSSGMFTSYIRYDVKKDFMRAIKELEPMQVTFETSKVKSATPEIKSIRSKAEPTLITLPRSTHKYYSVKTLPTILQNQKLSEDMQKFLKILCAMPALDTTKGFSISQIIVSNTLNINQGDVSRLVREAVKLGLLEVINQSYCPGIRAKTYVAKGLLIKAIRASKYVKKEVKPPKTISDGSWHDTLLWVQTHCFRMNPVNFLSWATSIPGINLKDRLKQAAAIHKWFVSKLSV